MGRWNIQTLAFFLRRTDQFTSGRRRSHGMPVTASMSGQRSAGIPSFFQRETEALETVRSGVLRSAASREVPPAALQASSNGEVVNASIVSEYYTRGFSFPKLPNGNIAARLYAVGMGFKERLREAREAAKLTGDQLGTKLAVSKSTISHWENGRYEPGIDELRALCDELRVSADWLIDRETTTLSAEAIQEARSYESLSAEDKRKWRAVRKTMFSTV